MLIGRPLWDKTRKKWRVLNGYQAVLGNTNNLFYEVTFTDTPYWENYADKQLYLSVPVEKEKQKESGDKGSNNKDKWIKTKNKRQAIYSSKERWYW